MSDERISECLFVCEVRTYCLKKRLHCRWEVGLIVFTWHSKIFLMCYFRSVPESPVIVILECGYATLRENKSHILSIAHVCSCVVPWCWHSWCLCRCQMTIEGKASPWGRLTCFGTQRSLETDTWLTSTMSALPWGKNSSVLLWLKTLQPPPHNYSRCHGFEITGLCCPRTSPFWLQSPSVSIMLNDRQRGCRRRQVGFVEELCSWLPSCLRHLLAARLWTWWKGCRASASARYVWVHV